MANVTNFHAASFLQPVSYNLLYCTLGAARHLPDEEFVQSYTVTPGAANG